MLVKSAPTARFRAKAEAHRAVGAHRCVRLGETLMTSSILEQRSERASGERPRSTAPDSLRHDAYEAPRVETVLTPEEMAREILYAGDVLSGDILTDV